MSRLTVPPAQSNTSFHFDLDSLLSALVLFDVLDIVGLFDTLLGTLVLSLPHVPDMAGLTFLAFGNRAPDLFTALLGAEDAPEMILGSSIGSGLFIFTVVFGLVIIFARDPPYLNHPVPLPSFYPSPVPKDSSSR